MPDVSLQHSPLVSVIVPIFNVERYLDQCLYSIRKQTYRNLEIICINDGSTDESLEILRRHKVEDERVIVIDKDNEGYGASCNKGLDIAQGEWISIVEPDDWIESEMYTAMLAHEQSITAPCEIIKTPYWRIISPDTPQQQKVSCSYRHRVKPTTQPFSLADAPHLIRHHPSIWSALYRAPFLKDHGIRFHEIPGAGWADNPFLADTLLRAKKIAYLDKPFYCYREETPEQQEASIKRNPLIPIERWNDVEDISEALEITDACIIEQIYHRGLNNLSMVLAYAKDAKGVQTAAEKMAHRMDPDLVFASKAISPHCKRTFAQLVGIPCPKIDEKAWKIQLFKEAIYTLRNAGPRYTASMIKRKGSR